MAGKKNTPKKENWEQHIEDKHHKAMVVKISVICVSVIIIILWGFALKNRFAAADWNRAPEYELIKTAQEQWKDIETTRVQEQTSHDVAYDAVKLKIEEIIEQISTSTIDEEKGDEIEINTDEENNNNESSLNKDEQINTNSQTNE